MRAMRVVGIVSSVVMLTAGFPARPANAQAPDAPSAWLMDRSDRLINVSSCALACFDLVYAHSTPAYYSFDTPRSVTLVYNSRTAYPRPFVIVDVQAASTGVLPDKMSIALKVNGVPVPPLDGSAPIYYLYGDASRPVARMKFQFDGSSYATGRYPIEAEIRAWSGPNSSAPVFVSGHVIIVNQLNSWFGAGWNIAGLQQIWVGEDVAVIWEGDGSAVIFQRACPTCSSWLAPDGDFSTLTWYSAGVGYYRRYPDGSEVHFREDGHMASIRDRFSNVTSFTWTDGLPMEIIDPAGKKFTLSYNFGKLQSIADPGSPARVTQLTYSGGNLQRITFQPDGSFEEFGYNTGAWDRLMSFSRSKSGHYTEYGYGLARQQQFTLFPAVAIADSAAPVRPKTAQQSIANMVDAMLMWGYGTASTPAPLMLAIHGPYFHDARDNRTSLTLDRFGAPTDIGHWVPAVGDHNRTQIFRNQHSLPIRVLTPRGDDTEYFWTSFKLDSIRNNRSGQRIRYGYTPIYNDVDSIFGDVAKVDNFWNFGRMDSTRLGPNVSQSPRTHFTYDSRGRVIRTAEADGAVNVTEYVYGRANLWENLDTVKIGPRRIVYQYDDYGRLTSVRDPEFNVVQTAYDDRNRPIRQVGMHADTTTFGYNDATLNSWVLDAKGQLYDMTFNALGWLESRTDPTAPNGRSDIYAYDLNGNLARWTNRRGQLTSFTYDVLNRLTSRNAAGSVTSYATDIYDRFTATSTPASTDTIYFDIHGRDSLAVSVRSGFAYRTLSTYDIRGRQNQQNVTSPAAAGTVTYGHENNYDRLANVSSPSGSINFNYNSLGQLAWTSYPPAITISQSFSSVHRLASVSPDGPAAQLQRFYIHNLNGLHQEQYNPNQNSVRLFNYGGGQRFWYSQDEEFTDYQCWPDPHWGNICSYNAVDVLRGEGIDWDKIGNPMSANVWDKTSSSSTSTTVAPGNRLMSMWDYAMSYDEDGNMTSRSNGTENRLLYWNAIGQLDSVRIGTQRFTYGYDGWGRRVSKTVAGVRTNFLWDGDQVIVESDVQHNVLGRYGFAGSRPIYLRRGTDTRYFVQQKVGSVTGMFNGSGGVTHTYDYLAFGKRIGADTPESFHNPLRFAGQYFDQETGMYYMRARYYDPSLYRFISEDPIGLDGGINPYVYAGNDPVNNRDPSGLCIDYDTATEEENTKVEKGEDVYCPLKLDTIIANGGGGWYRGWSGGLFGPWWFGSSFTNYYTYGGSSGSSSHSWHLKISYEDEFPERAALLRERGCPMPTAHLHHYRLGYMGHPSERISVRSVADVDRPILITLIGVGVGAAAAGGWALVVGSEAVGSAALGGAVAGGASAVPQALIYNAINCGHR